METDRELEQIIVDLKRSRNAVMAVQDRLIRYLLEKAQEKKQV